MCKETSLQDMVGISTQSGKKSAKNIVNRKNNILNTKKVDTNTIKWKAKHVMDREKKLMPMVNKAKGLKGKKFYQ